MQVILQKDVKHLGRRGDIVSVKNGYFSNYLLPKGLAESATRGRLKVAQVRLDSRVKKFAEMKSKAQDIKESLNVKEFVIKAKTTGKETLYAAIHESDVVELIKKELKLELDPSSIKIAEPIKKVGVYDVLVHLAESVEATIKLKVEADE